MPHPSHYLGDHRILTLTDRGDRMYLDTRDIMMTPGILCFGGWEPATTKVLEAVLKPGMSWADIGANNGYFTIIGHRLVQANGGRTWAFEASPRTYDLLVDNVYLNWFWDGVTVEQKAVYSSVGEVQFWTREKYVVNASIGKANDQAVANIGDTQKALTVGTVTIDDYFLANNIKLDFLKIDVEGGEYFVLDGGRRFLAENKNVRLLIEWSPDQIKTCGVEPVQLVELIEEFKFNCRLSERDNAVIKARDLLNIHDTTMVLLSR